MVTLAEGCQLPSLSVAVTVKKRLQTQTPLCQTAVRGTAAGTRATRLPLHNATCAILSLFHGVTTARISAVPTSDGAQNLAAPSSATRAAHCALLALRGRCEPPLAMVM